MATLKGLEPFKVVQQRQVPLEPGKPIPMKSFEINHPKNCGDPWIGAYSKHGFWYRFYEGQQEDYDKAVAQSFETDSYFMNYESLDVWKTVFENNFQLIVAKNQSEDVMGSVASVCYCDYAVVGVYYVMEEYRHSGIGEKLFREMLKRISGKIVIFHSMSHLKDKCYRFGLNVSAPNWRFLHCTLQNPSGFLDLKDKEVKFQANDVVVKCLADLDESEENTLFSFDTTICGIERSKWVKEWMRHSDSQTFVAVEAQQMLCLPKLATFQSGIVGYGNVREVAGGYVRRLLVAPLYAASKKIAKALLHALFKKFYNPEEDFEWDPDVFAIYRREVHFMVPDSNPAMLEVLNILKGETGVLTKERLYYETRCSGEPPAAKIHMIYAASDLHLSVV